MSGREEYGSYIHTEDGRRAGDELEQVGRLAREPRLWVAPAARDDLRVSLVGGDGGHKQRHLYVVGQWEVIDYFYEPRTMGMAASA